MRKILLIVFLFLLNPQFIFCSTEIEDIFSNLRKINQWKVHFEEEAFTQNGVIQRQKGEILYQYPLTFRISYKNHFILSDGYLLHFVFPDKKKFYTKKITDDVSENLIIQILSGSDKLLDLFDVRNIKRGIYELIPRENLIKNVNKIVIYTAQIGFPIERIEIFSKQLGIRLKVMNVSYKNITIDLSIPEDFENIKDPGLK